jgi:O-antigen/teichoic acid export membrane protein
LKREVVIYYIGKVIPAAFNLLLIFLAVKYLGQEKYGEFILLFNIVITIHTFTFGWVQQGVLRFLSQNKAFINITKNRFFVLINISSIAGIIILVLFNYFYFNLNTVNVFIVSAYLYLYNLYMYNLTVNQAQFKSMKYVTNEILYNLFFILIFLIFIIANYKNCMVIFLSMLISLVLVISIFSINYIKSGKIIYSKTFLNKIFFKKTLNYGIQITIWLSIAYFFNIVDRFIMKEFGFSYKEVGIYSAIYDVIFKISSFACVPILLAYHPRITFEWNNNKNIKSFLLLKKAIKIEILIFIAVFVVFLFAQNFIFYKLLNINYQGNINYISIPIICSAFIWQISILVHKPLELRLKQHIMVIGIVLSLIINVILNYLLIPRIGFQIAALNTLISVTFYLLFVLFFFIKETRLVLRHG